MGNVEVLKPNEKTTVELMQEVLDAKLSKSELADIVVDRLIKDIDTEVKALNTRRDKLEQRISKNAALNIIRKSPRSEAYLSNDRYDESGQWTVNVRLKLNLNELPKKVQAAIEERNEIQKRLTHLKDERYKLNGSKQKARLLILNESLQRTDEGRKLLLAIDELKGVVKHRILHPGKPLPTALPPPSTPVVTSPQLAP